MDISFSAEDLAFRDEVRAFFTQNHTAEIQAKLANNDTYKATQIEWQKTLADKGWIAPNWPVEYGGTGWDITKKFIFDAERAAAGIGEVVPFGLKMVGPVIYSYGNDEQKARFLPAILNSDDWWCQGYSEPGAGSDLAALQTKAIQDGDDYVVTGAKIWTTYAQYSDWIFCLVRTSSEGNRQSGISFLLIDMKSKGISINEIPSIDGVHTLNEVVFDNVRVPIANRIGNENQGWTYAKALLEHERLSIAGVTDSKRNLAQVIELSKQEVNAGQALINDPMIQKRLSDIEIELMALEYSELRVLAALSAGDHPGTIASMLKIKGTEIQQSLQTLRMDIAGYYQGVLQGDMSDEVLGNNFADNARKAYMYGRAATIYGGSNEVQRNVIAKSVLRL